MIVIPAKVLLLTDEIGGMRNLGNIRLLMIAGLGVKDLDQYVFLVWDRIGEFCILILRSC